MKIPLILSLRQVVLDAGQAENVMSVMYIFCFYHTP